MMYKYLVFVSSMMILYSSAYIRRPAQFRRASVLSMSKELEAIPANETPEEQRERLRNKIMKKMYNENGVAFAPWAVRQVNVEALIDAGVREEELLKSGGSSKKTKTTVLDKGEIQTAEGMLWRMKGNLVELGWQTGGESDNIGFIIQKRPSYGGDFQEVASFREVAALKSKGASGGRYSYVDPSTASGSWIYRILDCDSKGKEQALCQCFVETQFESEAKGQLAITLGLVAVFGGFLAAGFLLDSNY